MKKKFFIIGALLIIGTVICIGLLISRQNRPETVSLEMLYVNYYDSTDGLQRIQERMNDLLTEKLNVSLNITPVDSATYDDYLSGMLRRGQTVDIVFLKDSIFPDLVKEGMLIDLSDLITDYGTDILQTFSGQYEFLMDTVAGYSQGGLYGVPSLDIKTSRNVVCMRKDLSEECGIDISGIHSYEDLDEVYQVIHEMRPDITCLERSNQTFAINPMITFNGITGYEGLGDGVGVLLEEGSTRVVNLYESGQYKDFVRKMHQWYEKGYIEKDIATTSNRADITYKTGNVFSYFTSTYMTTEGCAKDVVSWSGQDTVTVVLDDNGIPFTKFITGIPVTSGDPAKALQVINEFYSNPELLNLFYYGEPKTDYHLDQEGLVKSEGASANKYYSNMNMITGNRLIADVRDYEGRNYKQELEREVTIENTTTAFGFVFDRTLIAEEYAQVKEIISEYAPGLEFGVLDPETTLPVFQQELRDAGIDRILSEKQKQLDRWLQEKDKKTLEP